MGAASRVILGEDGTGKPAVTPEDVLEEVSSEFGVAKRWLRASRRNSKRVCFARDELSRRLRDLGFSYYDIGKFLGGRTHVGIIYSVRRAEERLTQAAIAEAS